jgi:hypothetical protein
MIVSMQERVAVEEIPMDTEVERLFERARSNLLWLNEKSTELDRFSRYRGRYVAASEGDLFVGDSADEVERLARERHPLDIPHLRYIPEEKVNRIYAC